MTPAWGRCPMWHPEAIPGWLVPYDTTPHEHSRFPDTGVAVRLGIHPARHGPPGHPCIGSGNVAPVLPVNQGPTAAYALGLQREAMEPAQAPLF